MQTQTWSHADGRFAPHRVVTGTIDDRRISRTRIIRVLKTFRLLFFSPTIPIWYIKYKYTYRRVYISRFREQGYIRSDYKNRYPKIMHVENRTATSFFQSPQNVVHSKKYAFSISKGCERKSGCTYIENQTERKRK